MPGIDASIPLQIKTPQAPDMIGQAAQAYTLKSAMLQSQKAEQDMADQSALKTVMSDPNAFDADPSSGVPIPKPETMLKLYQTSPTAAQKLAEGTQKIRAEADASRKRAMEMQHSFVQQVGPVAATLAAEAEAVKGDDAAKWAAIAPKVDAANQQFAQLAQQAGIKNFKPVTNMTELQSSASQFSKYAENRLRAVQPQTPHERQTEINQAAAAVREDARIRQGDARIDIMDRRAGAAEARAAAVDARATDKKASFEGRNGEILAALAERGASLPTGFRSKEQQLGLLNALSSRFPDQTADQIAEKIQKGQLDLAGLKKEVQVAGTQAGKIAYAENEIKQTIPLVREASAKLPRGQFVPYNKLKQMGETAFSDPDLAEFRMYMTSLSNAYDMLAARGGTDMEKRKENRRNFDTAQGPEALERVMQAVLKEAAASGRAAKESMNVTRDRGGEDKPAPSGGAPKKPLSAFGGGGE